MDATSISVAEQQMRRGKYPNRPAFPFVGLSAAVDADARTDRQVQVA